MAYIPLAFLLAVSALLQLLVAVDALQPSSLVYENTRDYAAWMTYCGQRKDQCGWNVDYDCA